MTRSPRRKTQFEAQAYKDNIQHSALSPISTVSSGNDMFSGSDDFEKEEKIDSNTKILQRPVKFKIIDWVKGNSLVTTLIGVAICAIITFVIVTTSNLAVIDSKIKTIENSIYSLQDCSVEKDSLRLQLDLLKHEIDNGISVNFNNIQWRLDIIEDELDELKNVN